MRHTAPVLVLAGLLGVGCATPRPPLGLPDIVSDPSGTCERFAEAEVKRLGEPVPRALVRGLLVGVALDAHRVSAWLARLGTFGGPPVDPPGAPPPISSDPTTSGVPTGSLVNIVPWALIGGPQLAQSASRVNESVHEQAIRRCRAPARLAEALGPGDARVALGLEEVAVSYELQGNHAAAEPLRRRALTIWLATFGPRDRRVARAQLEHAAVLRQLGRVAEADDLAEQARAVFTDVPPPARAPAKPRKEKEPGNFRLQRAVTEADPGTLTR